MVMDPNEPVELYRARGADEAHALRAALERAGVPARVDGELLGGIAGEVPFGWVTAPRLLVPRGRLEAAEAVLADFLVGPAGRPKGMGRAWPVGLRWATTRRAGGRSTGSRPSEPAGDRLSTDDGVADRGRHLDRLLAGLPGDPADHVAAELAATER
jgi:hypothetical protein